MASPSSSQRSKGIFAIRNHLLDQPQTGSESDLSRPSPHLHTNSIKSHSIQRKGPIRSSDEKIYTWTFDRLSDSVSSQVQRLARLDDAFRVAIMPDVQPGDRAPNGCVLARPKGSIPMRSAETSAVDSQPYVSISSKIQLAGHSWSRFYAILKA